MRYIKFRHLFRLAVFGFALSVLSCQDTSSLFIEHPSNDTGITFNNKLSFNDTLSVLEFEYMYNGAGVAVADFDLDGLQDIFFTGNMVSNALYRNLGDWKFQDITLSANVASSNWSNGVAIVDIDQNGYSDIYVSRGGPRGSKGSERANLLFLNNGMKNGKLDFKEVAADWGLADESYSVQAAFFDYDLDGDLDMYLLSNALVDFNRNVSRPKDRTGKAPSVDKLFRNNGNHTFTEVSSEAGILVEGFGLGVEICDLNNDGWPDVYVSNDFLTDDLLYINQQNGTFKNEIKTYFQHLSFNGMGNDLADINNDGLIDVVVLDMLPPDNKRWKLTMMGNNYDEFQNALSYGYHPQYIRNTLQLNNGNGTFSEIGQLAGISATEWSWSALFADYDQDGSNDLFITNGYRKDITNLDFMVYGNRILTMGTEEANRKQRLEELNKLPGIKLPNYMFHNSGNLSFQEISKEAGFSKPTYSNGAAYVDLDNDGDLDLIVNNIDDPAGIYENKTKGANTFIKFKFNGQAPNLSGLGSQVEIYYQGKIQKQYFTPYRGYLSTVEQALYFGLGELELLDSLKVIWPDGKQQVMKAIKTRQELTLNYKDATNFPKKKNELEVTLFHKADRLGLEFEHKEDDFVDYKVQSLLPHMHSRNGPGIAVADINGDGMEDAYVGGASGQPGSFFVQRNGAIFEKINFMDDPFEDMGVLFFDADNDGDQDLYVVSGGSSFPAGSNFYQDRIYQNDGLGKFTKIASLPDLRASGSVVVASDFDKDGDLDLFVGGRVRPGEYPVSPESYLLENRSSNGTIKFMVAQIEISDTFRELGMVSTAIWTDFNNDSWPDLIVTGEFMPIRFFQNFQGRLAEVTAQTGLKHTSGWWNSIAGGDFDNDGDTDYVLGNLGLNSRYKATVKEPLYVYANDYDKNGQMDPVMVHYVNGEQQIAHSRNDLIDQINAMRARFRTYTDYAETPFDKSFLKEEIANAVVLKSDIFSHNYLENLGFGKFKISELPRATQIAPLYGMQIGDYNQDGNLDILAVGNFFSGEVFSGRYDASLGWFLAGNGKGHFNMVDVSKSGFLVNGDAKGLATISSENEEFIVVGINNGTLKAHAITINNQIKYKAKSQDIAALIRYNDGKEQKIEFYYGSGYLSQTSRSLSIPSNATSVLIIHSDGTKTEILSSK